MLRSLSYSSYSQFLCSVCSKNNINRGREKTSVGTIDVEFSYSQIIVDSEIMFGLLKMKSLTVIGFESAK